MQTQVGIPITFTAEVTSTDTGDWTTMDLVIHAGEGAHLFTRRVTIDVSGSAPGSYAEGVAAVGLMRALEQALS